MPASNDITLHDMTSEEIEAALLRTGLNIIFSAQPKDQPCIQAAHGDPDSFIIIRFPGDATHEWQGIRMNGGSRDERQQRYWAMLHSLERDGIGQNRTPAGQPVSFEQRDVRTVEGGDFLARRTFLRKQ